jgi:hypothetical protein
MRTMYDAIHPLNIPVTAQMVAGYVDGLYRWTAANWARFPNAVKVRIAVFPSTNDGHVLDVELGDATPAQAPGWVLRRRAAGIDPTVYCSLAAWPAVKAAFNAAHVTQPHYWIAAYPGNGANLYPGAVAHQYANPGPVDISVVADYWPGVDPAPSPASDIPPIFTTPATPPAPTPEVDMPLTDAEIHAISADVWNRFSIATATGPVSLTVALSRLLAQSNPAAFAAAVAKALPAGPVVTQAQLEAALRTVLGSVDGTP